MMRTHTQQFAEGFRRWQENVAGLEEFLSNPTAPSGQLDQLRDQVRQLHEDLGSHFERLDAGGDLEEMEIQAPHLRSRFRRLRRQKDRVMQELEDLKSEMDVTEPAESELCGRLSDLLLRIQEHETHRNLLVLDALYIEPAALD
jgi:chromosome segregation ATPase